MLTEKEIASLNALEFEVYKFVLNHREKIPYMTIRELATEAHVSTTTVLRFCKKMGCEGFSEFRLQYKLMQNHRTSDIVENDTAMLVHFLEKATGDDFDARLDEIAAVLTHAKSLVFTGMGNSGVMAQYAARYFSSIGKFAVHVENPMYNLAIENPEDCVVTIFSVSGEGGNIIENASALKSRGVPLASITNTAQSTLARISDYNISYYVQHHLKHDPGYGNKIDITTQLPVVYIIETLAKKVNQLQQNR